MSASLQTVLLLLEATVLGGLIGLERERSNQPAGLRTHAILCLGAALIMVVSERVALIGSGNDPGRIAAQVVTGIGFLGAGAIIRMGASVRGLTTAASLWTTGGVGLAVGARLHVEAIAVVVIMLATLAFVKKYTRRLSGRVKHRLLDITARMEGDEAVEQVEGLLTEENCAVREIDVRKSPEEETMRIRVQITTPRDFDATRLIEALLHEPFIAKAEIR
ncbi:MAG: MgtC/SapB family protein [Nitrospinota bacterium]|nr:MgtC/SapB family protein [Nitrospinota bacterium]